MAFSWIIEKILSPVIVTSKLTVVHQQVPGIGVGAAYATGDAFGTTFVIPSQDEGTITKVIFHDLDNEGLRKELWLFSRPFTETADNAAFAPTAQENPYSVGVIPVSTFYGASGNQIGLALPALDYLAPQKKLYGQWVTRGADNIAAGSIPEFTVVMA